MSATALRRMLERQIDDDCPLSDSALSTIEAWNLSGLDGVEVAAPRADLLIEHTAVVLSELLGTTCTGTGPVPAIVAKYGEGTVDLVLPNLFGQDGGWGLTVTVKLTEVDGQQCAQTWPTVREGFMHHLGDLPAIGDLPATWETESGRVANVSGLSGIFAM